MRLKLCKRGSQKMEEEKKEGGREGKRKRSTKKKNIVERCERGEGVRLRLLKRGGRRKKIKEGG